MIQLDITEERADELYSAGARTVTDPLSIGPAFIFTGPGLSLARLVYGDARPSNFIALDDMSVWDIAILRIQKGGTE
jgi:hypothetical protein